MGDIQKTTPTIPAIVDATGHPWAAQQVSVASVTTTIDKLQVVDVHAKSAYLEGKGHTGADLQSRLTGIFADPLGATADEVLEMNGPDDFASAQVVAGGIYYGELDDQGGSPIKRWTDFFVFQT